LPGLLFVLPPAPGGLLSFFSPLSRGPSSGCSVQSDTLLSSGSLFFPSYLGWWQPRDLHLSSFYFVIFFSAGRLFPQTASLRGFSLNPVTATWTFGVSPGRFRGEFTKQSLDGDIVPLHECTPRDISHLLSPPPLSRACHF